MSIIVGYVPTSAGEATLAIAAEEARMRTDRLVVVSVTRGESVVDPSQPQTSQLQHAVSRIRETGVDCDVRHLEQSRDPGEAILGVAEEEKASLVVIGLKRRSPVGKLLLGSTAQSVLASKRPSRTAFCSVEEGTSSM